MRRTPLYRMKSLRDLPVVLAVVDPDAVIFDVENTLTDYKPSLDALTHGLAEAVTIVRTHRTTCDVWLVSNGRLSSAADLSADARATVVDVLTLARKPNTVLNAPWPRVLVVGDQVLTDGLLAARNGGSYAHIARSSTQPLVSQLNRLIGESIARPLFFRKQRLFEGSHGEP